GVLEGEEVEEVEGAGVVEVGGHVTGAEEVLEGEKVEEREFAVAIEVGGAENAAEVEDVRGAGEEGATDGFIGGADDGAGAVGRDRPAELRAQCIGQEFGGLAPGT